MRTPATFTLAAAALVSLLATAPAYALREHSFVASYGSDSNPCSYLSPCATFQNALSQTVSGGEITAIDSDGFGPLNITQSVTITGAPGAEANVPAVTNGSSIVINGSAINVTLRNVTINGEGVGTIGIEIDNAASLTVTNCAIGNFAVGTANSYYWGSGIEIASASSSTFSIANSTIFNNATYGIYIAGGAYGSNTTTGIIANVSITGNEGDGIYVFAVNGGTATVAISKTTISNNNIAGIIAGVEAGTGTLQVSIDNTTITNNAEDGIDADGTVKVLLGRSVITGNGEHGIDNATSPNTFYSYKDNRINGNGAGTADDEFGTAPNTTTHPVR
jgi:hypothetical protein